MSEIILLCKTVRSSISLKIMDLAILVGKMIAASPSIQYSLLYIRQLEKEKVANLSFCGNNYNDFMFLSKEAKADLSWWIDCQKHPVSLAIKSFPVTIETDASLTGWGAHQVEKGLKAHGFWTTSEKEFHINALELKAVEYALCVFANKLQNVNILLRVDNTTAIAYLNRLGGCRSELLHEISNRIWKWCEERKIFLTASYISSCNNVIADNESRKEIDSEEWMLGTGYFRLISKKLGNPTIDLFASYIAHQCKRYVSWQPDPGSISVDAFLMKWNEELFYAFPPFCLVTKVLNKVIKDKAKGIVVVPYWESQSWYPVFKSMIKSDIIILGPSKDLLFCPISHVSHPLNRTLKLAVAIVSGNH